MLSEFLIRERIAYFTMEIALESSIPTYAGGLGILAGDTVRSAADLQVPLVAVSLVSQSGYFRQELTDQGSQLEYPDPWDPSQRLRRLGAKIVLLIENREVWVSAWLYVVQAHLGGSIPVVLLDTDLPENAVEDREISHVLYGGDSTYRFKQEMVLGIGGVRMLQALGFRIRKYHLNEGHAALLALELLRHTLRPASDVRPGELPYDFLEVREHCDFTTHTPVEAGHDHFDYALVDRLLGAFLDKTTLRQLGGTPMLNMTNLALNLSGYVNGVAKQHAETSRRMFPGYTVRAITNGVHPYTWVSSGFATLFDRHMPGWCNEPEILVRARCCLSDDEVWQAHQLAKRYLIGRINGFSDAKFDEALPIIGFARRMTAYKRPDLLFNDLTRLKSIGQKFPFQIVIAGKAHPQDYEGKHRIEHIHKAFQALLPEVRGIFLPNHDMALAQILIAGVDCWINTPQRPLEASGTSGMKAALNGVPSLSILDGWWIEGCIEGITGWSIGELDNASNESDANDLYNKLESKVMPLLHNDRTGWVAIMKNVISNNGSMFNSHRMMRRYASEAYL
ncbi:MAG: alpha-glucan family phosphorylase [Spongiibacteraceae bacterium]